MTRIALLGSTGQVGHFILMALLTTTSHEVVQLVQPASETKARSINISAEQKQRLRTVPVDLLVADTDELASILNGVEVVVSAVNGKALSAQEKVQTAAGMAGVRRFYPSEYGMHHVYTGEDGYGYVHPVSALYFTRSAWIIKSEANEKVIHHPAIVSGKMTYTLIGCGDLYNQEREALWCPWTQADLPSYTIHILGNPDAKVDFTHIGDLANFLVKTIDHPEVSENKELNFVSDHISYNEIAALLERYSRRKVEKILMPIQVMHRVFQNKEDVPEDLKGKGAFPDDFWIVVKGMQGSGRFWRPPGQVHNDLFPDVKTMAFEQYFQNICGS
ncbi:hypothetical protein ABOM_004519 [Aspergillus bombycis]|uniref:NmrA-like domain-containing protein n=1 Tax=Aspergillus bombycis TaxID=109264 RepID=A0A1F8A455_9EURO|nr:hypothetical protein ABOM_004519 [Aspergillus bombycis]OGM46522.1 hypothetical protein ABOM_004519 [Aspergillus bombycis]